MSRDDLNELDQLDLLTTELAEAGRLARVATAHREQPESAFATRLRAELLGELPAPRAVVDLATAQGSVAELPMPPIRPLEIADWLTERRPGGRPLVGSERRSWAEKSRSKGPDGVTVMIPSRADETRSRRRWEDFGNVSASRLSGGSTSPLPPSDTGDEDGHVVALKPSMRWHIPTSVLPSRWIAVGLAASIAVASLIYGSGIFWSPKAVATTDDAASAMLIRGGNSSLLVAGTELHENDEIEVAAGGRATLQLGDSYVRMAGGSDVQLKSLDANHVVVSQVAGRVYHRVAVPAGGDYQVATATVTWKAVGTAFDIDREATAGGGEQVRGLALYDGLDLSGPGLKDSLPEGSSAVVVLRPDGAPAGSPGIAPITAQTLADAWLIGNAGIDAQMGLPLGRLASLLSPSPTVAPTATPAPVATPKPVVATATPKPTPKPTPRPTPKPTPKPAPAGPPNLGQLKITHNGDGSYTFSWPKYTGSGFQYYKLMYGRYPSSPSYGTSGDFWVCNSSASDNSWTGFIAPGNYSVRLQVVDEPNSKVIIRAQTKIVHLTVTTPSLGLLGHTDGGGGNFTFTWTAYTKHPFDFYKLVFETTVSGKDPSYPGGSNHWAVAGTGATSTGWIAIPSGDYHVRIQAIGSENGAPFAYAQTTVLHLIVP